MTYELLPLKFAFEDEVEKLLSKERYDQARIDLALGRNFKPTREELVKAARKEGIGEVFDAVGIMVFVWGMFMALPYAFKFYPVWLMIVVGFVAFLIGSALYSSVVEGKYHVVKVGFYNGIVNGVYRKIVDDSNALGSMHVWNDKVNYPHLERCDLSKLDRSAQELSCQAYCEILLLGIEPQDSESLKTLNQIADNLHETYEVAQEIQKRHKTMAAEQDQQKRQQQFEVLRRNFANKNLSTGGSFAEVLANNTKLNRAAVEGLDVAFEAIPLEEKK